MIYRAARPAPWLAYILALNCREPLVNQSRNYWRLRECVSQIISAWGDNRQNPNDHVWAALTDVDVLVLPVDASQHILSHDQADKIVARIKPHVIIPEHYLTKGASITLTTLGSAEEWTKK